MDILTFTFMAGGLNSFKDTLMGNWLAPAFFIAVAVFAIVFIKDRAWMKLIGFVGIAAVVGVLMFGTESLFGPNGAFSKVAIDAADEVGQDAGNGKAEKLTPR